MPANTSGTVGLVDASTDQNEQLNLKSPIIIGVPNYTSAGGVLAAHFQGSINSFYQANISNNSSGSSASSDWVVTANNGTESTHYADFGINSSGGGAAPFTAANAAASSVLIGSTFIVQQMN